MNTQRIWILVGIVIAVLIIVSAPPVPALVLLSIAALAVAGWGYYSRKQWSSLSEGKKKRRVSNAALTRWEDQLIGLMSGEIHARLDYCSEQLDALDALDDQHSDLKAQHHSLQQEHRTLYRHHESLKQKHHNLAEQLRALHDQYGVATDRLRRSRQALLPSTDERLGGLFQTWCTTAGGSIRDIGKFRDHLKDAFRRAHVRTIYRDESSDEVAFSEEPTGGATYWLVSLEGVGYLFPLPRNPHQFVELSPVYGGVLSPVSVQHVVPATVGKRNDQIVLQNAGFISAFEPAERYVPEEPQPALVSVT